jgi:hypothetical protein
MTTKHPAGPPMTLGNMGRRLLENRAKKKIRVVCATPAITYEQSISGVVLTTSRDRAQPVPVWFPAAVVET